MPVGFEGESFQQAVSESRGLMRSGYASADGDGDGARELLEQAGKLAEREAAREEQSGVLSPRSASLNLQRAYARSAAVRAGVVDDDAGENDDDDDNEGEAV